MADDSQEISQETQEIMDDINMAHRTLTKVRADYDNRIILLQKRIADLTHQLRNSDCDHEWIREAYAYSELYCKHCGVWYR
jgi:uncharacterized protein YbaR (Trm112 family)